LPLFIQMGNLNSNFERTTQTQNVRVRLPRNLIESNKEEVRKDHRKLHNEKLHDLYSTYITRVVKFG